MNENRPSPLVVTNGLAPGDASRGLLLGGEACEQACHCRLGGGQVLLAASQDVLEGGQLGPQGRVRAVRDVAHVRAPGGPDLHDAVRGEQPDGGLGGVEGDVVSIPELPVRRYLAAGRVRVRAGWVTDWDIRALADRCIPDRVEWPEVAA